MKTGELPGDYYMAIIQLAMVLGIFVTIVAFVSYLCRKKEVNLKSAPDNIPVFIFLAYLALIVVSTIVNKTDINYIFGFTSRAEGVLSFFCYYLVYYFCGSLVRKGKYKYFLVYFFLLTGLVIGILTLLDRCEIPIDVIYRNGICGIFYHCNFYGYYLSMTIPLAAALTVLDKCKKRRILAFVIFCLNSFICAINNSFGPFLAINVALLFLVVAVSIKKKKFSFPALAMLVLFLLIIFVTGLFTPSYFSELTGLVRDVEKIATDAEDAGDAGTMRWTLWTHTWQYIKEKPWIGWGFEGTAERLGTETHADKAHNEYLENMAYYGIPAGLTYLAALISVYIKALKRRKHVDDITLVCLAGALGYIGSALVGNSLIFMAPYCFIFLGLGNQTIEDYEEPAPVAPDEGEEDDAEATCECLQDGPEKITVDNGAETGDNKRASEETEVTE